MENQTNDILSISGKLSEVQAKYSFMMNSILAINDNVVNGIDNISKDFSYGQYLIFSELETAFKSALEELDNFCETTRKNK